VKTLLAVNTWRFRVNFCQQLSNSEEQRHNITQQLVANRFNAIDPQDDEDAVMEIAGGE